MSDARNRAMEIARAAAAKAKTAQEATAAADVIRAAAVTPLAKDQTPATAANTDEKKLSPKHKDSRGVPAGFKTTWVPLDLPAEENERLLQVAAVRDTKIGSLLAQILKEQLTARKAEFDADVAKYVPSPKAGEKTQARLEKMDVDELEAEVAKQMAAMEKLRQLMEARKAAAAPTTPTDAAE